MIGVDLEKTLEGYGTGISTKAGELLTVTLDNLDPVLLLNPALPNGVDPTAYWGNVASASVVITFDAIMMIKDSGVDLYD